MGTRVSELSEEVGGVVGEVGGMSGGLAVSQRMSVTIGKMSARCQLSVGKAVGYLIAVTVSYDRGLQRFSTCAEHISSFNSIVGPPI